MNLAFLCFLMCIQLRLNLFVLHHIIVTDSFLEKIIHFFFVRSHVKYTKISIQINFSLLKNCTKSVTLIRSIESLYSLPPKGAPMQLLFQNHKSPLFLPDGHLLFRAAPLLKIDGMELVQTNAILNYVLRKAGLVGKDAKEQAW